MQKAAKLDPDNAPYLNSVGFLAYQFGDLDKAINYLERALILDKAYYGENHPAVASLMNNLGTVWSKKGDPKKALQYLDQALSFMTNDLGPDHPQTKSVQAKRDEVAATVN